MIAQEGRHLSQPSGKEMLHESKGFPKEKPKVGSI